MVRKIKEEEIEKIKTMYENGDTLCHISKIINRSVFSIRKICVYKTEINNSELKETKERHNRKCKICKKEHNENVVYVGRYGICFDCFSKSFNNALTKLEKTRTEIRNKDDIVLNTKT